MIYYSCVEIVAEMEISVAGTYTKCVRTQGSIDLFGIDVFLTYVNNGEAYNNRDNSGQFTSSFVNTNVGCEFDIITQTQTPTYTPTPTQTPTITPTITDTPTQTPTQTPSSTPDELPVIINLQALNVIDNLNIQLNG